MKYLVLLLSLIAGSVFGESAQFISQSAPLTMLAGQRYPVSVTVRNTGYDTWVSPIRLGSQSPQDNGTWGLGRVELPGPVAPGQTTTINFNVTAPATAGGYPFRWRMVKEGVAWFGEMTPELLIGVDGPLSQESRAAQFVSQTVPTVMAPGVPTVVTVRLKNVGTMTWTNDQQFRLGAQSPRDNSTWGASRFSVPASGVLPGQTADFTFRVVPPTTPGDYDFQWQMLQEGITWYGNLTPKVRVTVSNTPVCGALDALAADTWCQIPNTHLRDVCPSQDAYPFWFTGVGGCGGVVSAWSGGAYDSRRTRLIVWGGGHSSYLGNEIYDFGMETLRWGRLTDPSPPPYSRDVLVDGNPVSRETYGGLAYLAHADRFFGYGGARSDDGAPTPVTWTLDFATNRWQNMNAGGVPPGRWFGYGLSSAYDPLTKQVFMRDVAGILTWSLESNTWTPVLDAGHGWTQQTGAIDPTRRLFFSIGQDEFLAYDMTKNSDATPFWRTTGGEALIHPLGPGLDYDPRADRMVAWMGGGVFVLDPTTKVWARKSGLTAPPAQTQWGTYGRFRYVAKYNVFVLVNSVDENVYIYKHTAGP